MEGLEESECNAMEGPTDCQICGNQIYSNWQIKYPGTTICEACYNKECYQAHEDLGVE